MVSVAVQAVDSPPPNPVLVVAPNPVAGCAPNPVVAGLAPNPALDPNPPVAAVLAMMDVASKCKESGKQNVLIGHRTISLCSVLGYWLLSLGLIQKKTYTQILQILPQQ